MTSLPAKQVRYKYCGPQAIDLLRDGFINVSDPGIFNDPFEIRPYFDEERKTRFVKQHEDFYASLGLGPSLAKHSLQNVPVEHIIDFDTTLHEEFFRFLSKRYRLLCLSRIPSSNIMWSHYAANHQGLVIGVDIAHPDFDRGDYCDTPDVNYVDDRSTLKLPLEFYDHIKKDVDGHFLVSEKQLVKCGGIIVSAKDRESHMQKIAVTALRAKHADWSYEQEVRLIYDLACKHASLERLDKHRHGLRIPSGAITDIVLGYRAAQETADRVLDAVKRTSIDPAVLAYATYHPTKYEVLINKTTPDYLRAVYGVIRPSHKRL